jgi:hypothetical protein
MVGCRPRERSDGEQPHVDILLVPVTRPARPDCGFAQGQGSSTTAGAHPCARSCRTRHNVAPRTGHRSARSHCQGQVRARPEPARPEPAREPTSALSGRACGPTSGLAGGRAVQVCPAMAYSIAARCHPVSHPTHGSRWTGSPAASAIQSYANLDQPNFLLEAMKLFCSSPRRWVLST